MRPKMYKVLLITTTIIVLLFSYLIATQITKEGTKMALPTKPYKIELKSNAFSDGELIPQKYTCDGDDISPSLSWSKLPDNTKEIVLICEDPDAPGRIFTHWVFYGLSPDSTMLQENVAKKEKAAGGLQGKNDFGKIGYGGPCPPRGSAHRYYFKLSAIDKQLNLKPGLSKSDLLKVIEGHILAQGELIGRYARKA
jgi:Raf kinase inhibitor-like YbhB/YbcL family protein